MKSSRLFARLAAAGSATALAIALVGCGSGQTTETSADGDFTLAGPARMVIPFGAGGGVDLAGRTVADLLQSEGLVDEPVDVENVEGGNAIVGMSRVKQEAGADDLLMITGTHLVVAPLTVDGAEVTYQDFTPIATLFAEYVYVYVRADSPLQNLADLKTALQADPGALRFGGGHPGGSAHFATVELLEGMDVPFADATYVSYDDNEAIAALMGNHIEVATGGPELLDLVAAGDLRVLAVSAAEPLTDDVNKGIPTFKEGGSDSSLANWRIITGPPDMSDPARTFWADRLRQMTESTAWSEALATNGWSPYFLEGDELESMLDSENQRYQEVMESVGLTN